MLNIIDSHVHATINGNWMDTHKDSSLKKLLNEMNLASIKRAVLIAIDGFISNNFILKVCLENSNVFFPFCSINPVTTSFKDFVDLLKVGNFYGVKIHPRIQNFSLADEIVIKFFKKVERIPNFLILLDCWFSDQENDKKTEETIKFINSFKKLKIILAHAGGFHYESIIPLAIKDNIFIDLSYTPTILRKYKKEKFHNFFLELQKIDSSNIIFGLVFTEVSIKDSIYILTQSFDKYGFSRRDQENIFSKNIEMLIDNLNSEV